MVADEAEIVNKTTVLIEKTLSRIPVLSDAVVSYALVRRDKDEHVEPHEP